MCGPALENRARRARKTSILAAVAVLTAGLAHAQTITRGPFIQNPDAQTSTITVEWWTNVAGNSTVEYGLTQALGLSATVAQAGSCEIGAAGTCHTVPLTGLLPGTRYFYQLRTNGTIVQAVTSTTYFATLKTQLDPTQLFFTVIGDWGACPNTPFFSSCPSPGDGNQMQAVANNQDAADPPMIITVGDNAYQNGTQSDWDNHALWAYRTVMQRVLFFPILGNHDVNNVGAANWANSAEIKLFLLPLNGIEQERYYSFDSGDAHFTMLDSNNVDGTQTGWLDADLATTTRKWKFVFFHHTPYSCASGAASIGSNLTVRNTWGPIFEKHGVDIVFDGHDHSYERTHFIDDYLTDGSPGQDGLGTYYVMTGGGGAVLDGAASISGGQPMRSGSSCYWLDNNCPGGPSGTTYCSFSRFHHTSVRIDTNTMLTLQAIDNSNTVFDTFTLTKGLITTTTTTAPTTTSTTTTTASTTTTTTTTTTTVSSTTTTTTVPTTTTTTATTTTTTTTLPTTTTTTTTTSTTVTTTTTTSTATTTSTTTTTESTTTTSTTATTTTSTTSTTTSTIPPCVSDADGDLVCDPDDNCPTVPNPSQADGDNDDLGDACDPCTGGVPVVGPRLSITKVVPPPGDERFTFAGVLTLPVPFNPPLDPVQNGIRVLVVDTTGATVIDETTATGLYNGGTSQGWRVNASGWKYRSRSAGIVKAVLKLSHSTSGQIKFVVKGRTGSWTVSAGQLPLRGTLILDPPYATTGECGNAAFPGPSPSCALTGSSVKCR